MTGRDLILYILSNNLEDEPLYKDGKILGFMNEAEAAVKFNVGVTTIRIWYRLKILEGVKIGEALYFPANAKPEGE